MRVKLVPAEKMYDANCYLLIDDSGEAAVVDPGSFGKNLMNTIENEHVTVKHILLTHGHFDHILGVSGLKKTTGADVYIHSLDRMGLFDEDFSLMTFFRLDDSFEHIYPDVDLKDGDEIKVGTSVIKVMHTPGHTPGGVCYLNEKDGFIISGDTLFRTSIGRTDFPHSSSEDMLSSLKRLYSIDRDYDIYPGHGEPTTLNTEKKINYYFRGLKNS